MIDTVVFDMGQVLIRWSPELLMAPHDLTEEDQALLKRELFATIEWVQLDRGSITEEEALKIIRARLPERLHGVAGELVSRWWTRALHPMEGMEDLVRELSRNGYGIYVLSNAGLSLRQYWPRLPGADCFRGVVVSAEEKLLKPQKEIFDTLLARYGLEAERCVFVDDLPANCEGAVNAGLHGCIFRGDVKQLRADLRRMGIRCEK
ncbi:MAG: HAD family phosphatase [Clostridia bacterium]|nr:HAD family phosphatase [Clostridia bacterium]